MGETAHSNSICVCTDRTTLSKAALASRPARLLWRPLSTALRPGRPGPVRCILYRSERRSGAVDGVCEEACAERLCCVDRLSGQELKVTSRTRYCESPAGGIRRHVELRARCRRCGRAPFRGSGRHHHSRRIARWNRNLEGQKSASSGDFVTSSIRKGFSIRAKD
jgi:hypothetical protein